MGRIHMLSIHMHDACVCSAYACIVHAYAQYGRALCMRMIYMTVHGVSVAETIPIAPLLPRTCSDIECTEIRPSDK